MRKNFILVVGLAVVIGGTFLLGLAELVRRYQALALDLETTRAEGTAMAATLRAVTIPDDAAEPFTIAFLSDSETLSRWDEVLAFIKAEGAEMIVHQGDYVEGINPQTLQPATLDDFFSQEILDEDGSPTGELNCDRELQGIRCVLGKDFPVLGPPVGKSLPPPLADYFLKNLERMESQGGVWGGCVRVGELGDPGVRMNGCGEGDELYSARAGDYWVRWKGVSLAFQNAMPDPSWIPNAFREDKNIWKVCLWHGNHIDFQAGSKGNGFDGRDHSLPYEMYRNCADRGALIINGNEHGCSRTCILEDIGSTKSGRLSDPNRVNRKPGTALENHGAVCQSAGLPNEAAADKVEELEIGPGRSMVLVSALPGYAWRAYAPSVESQIEQDTYRHQYDGWWATMFTLNRYCRNNCTLADLSGQNPDAFVPGMNPPQKVTEPAEAPWDPYSDGHGVLFITFNYQGDPYRAHGYFKKLKPDPDTNRQVVDEFILNYRP